LVPLKTFRFNLQTFKQKRKLKMKTEKTLLQKAFSYFQRDMSAAAGWNAPVAVNALKHAKAAIAKGETYFPRCLVTAYNPQWEKQNARWIENLSNSGLRFVGYADKLTRMDHTGWYCDAFQDETLRGCVLQMPARNGKEIFLPAYEDPCNAGTYAVCFDWIEGERGSRWDKEDQQALRDAARAADSFAEHQAEDMREHDEAWQRGRQYAELRDEIANERDELRALVRELKTAREHGPAICKALRETVREKRDAMHKAWQQAEDCKAGIWRELYGAFNDGAGETVLTA
jgi:hypothetical protein